jgi:ABC-type lipoprotein export system ATPase subunit
VSIAKLEYLRAQWKAIASRESLTNLGEKIVATVPEKEKSRFGSPLFVGFSNINFRLDEILNRLGMSDFDGKYLTAVGKTEWWDIKWNDRSVADKKTIINSADLVFIAAESIGDCRRAKDHLTASGVNDRLLDCSDAHVYSDSSDKDRLGNCFTWIKGDTTFQGLKLALVEPDERIFIGSSPEQLGIVQASRTKFIRSLAIKKVENSRFPERWFDVELPLNHGLVAIIGNKGSGKSALADVMGLLGNSRHQDTFSFLNHDKFRKLPENKAQHYEAELLWESDTVSRAQLDSDVDSTEVETIKYIPQNYFETVCTELGDIEESTFDREIKHVIYSHVDRADRLGQLTLDELISLRSSEIVENIGKARLRIQQLNVEIVDLENKLTEEYREGLRKRLAAKDDELRAHDRSKPAEVPRPAESDTEIGELLQKAEQHRVQLEQEIEQGQQKRVELAQDIASVESLIEKVGNFREEYEAFRDEFTQAASGLGIEFRTVVTLVIDEGPLTEKLEQLRSVQRELDSSLDESNQDGLRSKLLEVKAQIKELTEQLDRPNREYQAYVDALQEWEKARNEIIGTEADTGSLKHIQKQIQDLEAVPERLEALYEKRRSRARSIYRNIKKIARILEDLYSPIQRFFDTYETIKDMLDLQFGVSILNTRFQEHFFDWINLGRMGSFMGANQGKERISALIEMHDFNKEKSALGFIDEILEHLVRDKRTEEETPGRITDQLKKGRSVESLYDFVFSLEYLEPRYVLRLGDKELSQLSPGERGALLLVFYLLIDRDTIPLVIDQPEHNLDNETVTKLLVPAIREAKLRRQIVMITHNPILAVVCNADQVICASLDIGDNYKLEYVSGAIENPETNRKIVDILEGTMKAFDNRRKKYLREFFEAYPFLGQLSLGS